MRRTTKQVRQIVVVMIMTIVMIFHHQKDLSLIMRAKDIGQQWQKGGLRCSRRRNGVLAVKAVCRVLSSEPFIGMLLSLLLFCLVFWTVVAALFRCKVIVALGKVLISRFFHDCRCGYRMRWMLWHLWWWFVDLVQQHGRGNIGPRRIRRVEDERDIVLPNGCCTEYASNQHA